MDRAAEHGLAEDGVVIAHEDELDAARCGGGGDVGGDVALTKVMGSTGRVRAWAWESRG